VTISDDGCAPRQLAAKAGATTFTVHNDGSASVTEFEILDGSKILGEVENVVPGTDRSFSLTLEPGKYVTYCPNGKVDKGVLEVADAPTAKANDSAAAKAAVDDYLRYVKGEADRLVTLVVPFAAAVKAGDVAQAKRVYAATRAPYEAIEPIAESFGDLDPAIDVREPNAARPDDFTGFHRIEKALWVTGNLDGMAPIADKLVADVHALRTKIDTVELEPAKIANGAVELLNEVSTSKISGEEEAYSHTDLSDFAANLAGSKAAFDAVKPMLATTDASLASTIEQRFAAVQQALDAHRGSDPTGNGYVLFNTLDATSTKALSAVVDTLAEPMSNVAAKLL